MNRLEKVIELEKQGKTRKEIASILNLKLKTVYAYFALARNPMPMIKGNREYYRRNREKICRQERERYLRNKRYLTRIGIGNGKTLYGVSKRERPETCELCNKNRKRLSYHHWDKPNFNMGMWLCAPCHYFAERADTGFFEKYLALKKKIELELREAWNE